LLENYRNFTRLVAREQLAVTVHNNYHAAIPAGKLHEEQKTTTEPAEITENYVNVFSVISAGSVVFIKKFTNELDLTDL
jgi:hypothetical protein